MIKKKANKKGFTIMEMLIVVAIIAVLAAIAIPTFNGALTKSKEAADVANIRAAYAEVQVQILTEDLVSTSYKSAFETALGTTSALNYADKYSFNEAGTKIDSAGSDDESNKYKLATIVYKADKLEGKNGKTWKWELESPTVE